MRCMCRTCRGSPRGQRPPKRGSCPEVQNPSSARPTQLAANIEPAIATIDAKVAIALKGRIYKFLSSIKTDATGQNARIGGERGQLRTKSVAVTGGQHYVPQNFAFALQARCVPMVSLLLCSFYQAAEQRGFPRPLSC